MAGGDRKARGASDLGVRAASAVVMVAVAGTALWLGGWFWAGFVLLVAVGVFREWRAMVVGFARSAPALGLWNAAGLIYLGIAAAAMIFLRNQDDGALLLSLVATVIATDIGAYFAGRTIGGAKIAPKISPSKTWAGLFGGMLAAGVVFYLTYPGLCFDDCYSGLDAWLINLRNTFRHFDPADFLGVFPFAAFLAVVAQSGDFFESWMKRRAGIKDSGQMLPGHGGLFDRVDGLLAVMLVIGVYFGVLRVMGVV